MAEISEQPSANEVKKEPRVVEKVKQGIHKAWEAIQADNKEYWEIRQSIQDRLAWHGRGVYKYYVENMDKVTNAMWGSKEPKFGNKVVEVGAKIKTRMAGALLAGSSATLDIFYNVATWPARQVLPIPKDIFKRRALLQTMDKMVARTAVEGGMITAGAVASVEPGIVKGIKGLTEAVVTAPEVAAKMTAKRVHAIVEKIKKPHQPLPAKA